MGDDRGTDYVNAHVAEQQRRSLPELELARRQCVELGMVLRRCGFEDSLGEYLMNKVSDIHAQVTARQLGIQKAQGL
jgi:hypothetical protein